MTTNALTASAPSSTPSALRSTGNPVASVPGIGSTLMIAGCTAFLMVTSSVAVWSQVEPVFLLVAKVAG